MLICVGNPEKWPQHNNQQIATTTHFHKMTVEWYWLCITYNCRRGLVNVLMSITQLLNYWGFLQRILSQLDVKPLRTAANHETYRDSIGYPQTHRHTHTANGNGKAFVHGGFGDKIIHKWPLPRLINGEPFWFHQETLGNKPTTIGLSLEFKPQEWRNIGI